jgi:ARG/rhodanese/phosphatase superfamily protein
MDTNRRQFLCGCGIGLLGAVAAPSRARAERLRVLGETTDVDRPAVASQVSLEFQRWMRAARTGHSAVHGGLLVFWLTVKDQAPALDVATLDEARRSGALLITERDQATVPELIIENRGKGHVLLLAGEILVGGKQNRVLREDILLSPLSGPRPIGVYCVEQGRWNEGRKEFESKGSLAQPGLRSKLMERPDQGRVWDQVAKAAREAAPASQSPTGSYQAIYDDSKIKDHTDEIERAAPLRPPALAHGAAVFAGASLPGLDLFHSPGLFAREWPKLLRAYAVETYQKMPPRDVPEAKLRAHVEAVLAQAARVEGSVRGNAGVGQLFEFRVAGNRGAALLFEGRAIHTAIL